MFDGSNGNGGAAIEGAHGFVFPKEYQTDDYSSSSKVSVVLLYRSYIQNINNDCVSTATTAFDLISEVTNSLLRQ